MIENLKITDQINGQYRTYALYVLQSRGIPNFYDSLTPVQRLTLTYAPKSFSKTTSLIGNVIGSDLYHHGPASLEGAINKLARPFGCSEQLLLGDGYFGTAVKPDAAASRYTSVKINSMAKSVLDKNWKLNEKNHEGGYDWLHVELPLGLLTHINGIAVGYRSNILPRKKSDVEAYLKGQSKLLKPYFKDFEGKVTRSRKYSAWLIEGICNVDQAKREISVTDLPPLIRYDSFLKRALAKINTSESNIQLIDNSSTNVDITIKFKSGKDWKEFSAAIEKYTKILCTENLIFIRDGGVVEYTDIKEYLDEFKVHREEVILKKMKYDLGVMNDELEFLKAKLLFLKYMMASKRKADQVRAWMKPYKLFIRRRLDAIRLVFLTEEHIKETAQAIRVIEKEIESQKKTITVQAKVYKTSSKKTTYKGHNIDTSATRLVMEDELEEVGGIEVWKGDYSKETSSED